MANVWADIVLDDVLQIRSISRHSSGVTIPGIVLRTNINFYHPNILLMEVVYQQTSARIDHSRGDGHGKGMVITILGQRPKQSSNSESSLSLSNS